MFDVAGQVLVVEVAEGRETAREVQTLTEATADTRIRQLAAMGVQTLVCAGISQPLEVGLTACGIRVIAQVCGHVDEVLSAFIAGRLEEERFAMPGCCRQRRQRVGGQAMGGQAHRGGRGCQRGRGRGRKENP